MIIKQILTNIIFIIYFLSFSVFAQTGPGGVGKNDGSSNLKIWLIANDLDGDGDTQDNPANGTVVSTWSDLSGNSNDFTQSTVNIGPTYKTTGNFNAVYYHPDSTQYMKATNTGSYSSGSAFFVVNIIKDSRYNTLFNNNDYSLRSEQYDNTSKVGYTIYGGTDYATSINSPFNTDAIISYHTISPLPMFSKYIDIYVNNSTESLTVSSSAEIPYDNLGKVSSGSNRTAGSFYEVILFNQKLNTAQKIIVDNYLSAKYGSISIEYDLYYEDDNSNGDYDYDVAGIGRIDASNIQDDSQGTGIVRISNPKDLNNDEFLLWGHDGGTQEAIEISDVPAGVEARFDRVWRVSEVNSSGTAIDVGSIDISFDLTGLGSVTETDLRLLIDTDNDGIFSDETPIDGATNSTGNVYKFSGVSDIIDSVRFTLGTIDVNQTPLPITLVYFNAKNINNKYIELKWQTATEINNDYFTVQKSHDGLNWKIVEKIQGAGNSSVINSYVSYDYNLVNNISYYRIKQTDFNGNSSYSEIKLIKINEIKPNQITVYPNPASTVINIENDELINKIEVRDISGQIIFVKNVNNTTTKINVEDLEKGIYLLNIYIFNDKYVNKIIIN